MKQYRYLLFDMDGTLVYSHPGIFACLKEALANMGRTPPGDDVLSTCIGPPLSHTFSCFFGFNREETARATEYYFAAYERIGWKQTAPVEGMQETLKTLKRAGYVLAVATSKSQGFAEKIVRLHGLGDLFSTVVGSGRDGSLSTKAQVIEEAIRRLGAEKAECLMIGDRKQDLAGARDCGIDSVGLDVGYAVSDELSLENPTYYAKNYAQLRALLT